MKTNKYRISGHKQSDCKDRILLRWYSRKPIDCELRLSDVRFRYKSVRDILSSMSINKPSPPSIKERLTLTKSTQI